MEIDWPYNTDPVKPSILKISTEEGEIRETFEPCNHYTLQAESFAKSILNDTPVEISLDDSIANMAVLDKIRGEIGRATCRGRGRRWKGGGGEGGGGRVSKG